MHYKTRLLNLREAVLDSSPLFRLELEMAEVEEEIAVAFVGTCCHGLGDSL